ncbi:MAG: hypothetical protein KGJ23_12645 [Euryarchaeota archaeon]|nr:hypothetical protein [Euryarchaeota archaeon]MDE1837447.1 hypothetical protein [Euryarchaeota archaeon]MDE1882010.1 hypothetical protein [Euryarchaeota archaeon]MDE2045587.1 hypothetical protein [Thermoplasmata archaeon]
MVEIPRTRRELFAEVSRRLESGGFGQQQLKVYWLEVNQKFSPAPRQNAGWALGEKDFYYRRGIEDTDASPLWLDAANPRIWYVYTFQSRERTEKVVKDDLLSQRGVDRVWLPESFLERVRRRSGFEGRGFRFSFMGLLAKGRTLDDLPSFSGKFWLGSDLPQRQIDFVRAAEQTFTKSSLRMSRPSRSPDIGSRLLLELYGRGHMTVAASEDPEEILTLVNEIGSSYSGELGEMENRRLAFPRPIEFKFKTELNLERFQELVESGIGDPRLWMQRYEVDGGLHRYTGVDLHTSELVDLDIAEAYAYLGVNRGGCMNAAPRLMTVSSTNLSSRTEMFYEGAPLFA